MYFKNSNLYKYPSKFFKKQGHILNFINFYLKIKRVDFLKIIYFPHFSWLKTF